MGRLLRLLEETLELIENLEDDTLGGFDSLDTTHVVFHRVFKAQMNALRSIAILVRASDYRSCFILLRSVFESNFYFRLMLEGKRFRETKRYAIIPNEGSTKLDARDKTFDKWQEDWKRGKSAYKDVKAINKGHGEDVIHVTYERVGLFEEKDVERRGEVIPMFYFAFEEYNPELHYLADLPTVSVGFYDEDVRKEHRRRHASFYSQYFRAKKIVYNLKMNGFLKPEEEDRFWVHYNFLSSFTHLTKVGLLDMDEISTKYGISDEKANQILTEVVLLYACTLLHHYLSAIIGFFKPIHRQPDTLHKYDAQIVKLQNATEEFWFVHNNPTEFDVETSKLTKESYRLWGKPVETVGTVYYTDPIKRQINLKNFTSRQSLAQNE